MPTVPQRRPPAAAPTQRERLVVSAQWWNRLVDRWFRDRVRSITSLTASGWRHPFHTRLLPDEGTSAGTEAAWMIDVHPGYCLRDPQRGDAPRVLIPGDESADVPDGYLGEVDPVPRLSITASSRLWRRIGTDAEDAFSPEPVPDYFREQGVRDAGRLKVNTQTSSISSVTAAGDPEDDPAEARLLRACDLVLQVDRPGVRVDWDLSAAAGGRGFARAQLTLAMSPSAKSAPWLRLVSRHQPEIDEAATDVIDPRSLSTGGFAQRTHDLIRIATLYLLSPAGTPSNSTPDETWAPHVANAVFWNLVHRLEIDEAAPPPDPITVPLFLAGGVAQPIADAITASLNDQSALLAAAIGGLRVRGTFGTA